MQAVLVMFRADGQRRSFSLHKDLTVIGRREDCDLRIPLGEISRKHCRFIKDGEALRIEDLGSSNGTYHNGQRVQEADVAAGDTVQVGSIVFVVQIDNVPADDELSPVVYTPPAGDSGAPARSAADSDTDTPQPSPAASDPTSDEFDPMAFLGAGDTGSDQPAMDIDIDQSSHGEHA